MSDHLDSAEAKRQAKEVRDQWIQKLTSGEVSIDDALVFAKTDGNEAKWMSNIRLKTILEKMPGWSESAAVAVLVKNGMKASDTLRTLRSAQVKAGKFKDIFYSPSPSFASTRPDMPPGWPWQGKLADLVRATGQMIPALEQEVFGDEVVSEKRSALPVPGMRANPRTGEIIDPEPFWEELEKQIEVQPEEPTVTEDDIAALFGDSKPSGIDEKDIEEWLS